MGREERQESRESRSHSNTVSKMGSSGRSSMVENSRQGCCIGNDGVDWNPSVIQTELLRVRQDRLHRGNKHGARDEVLTASEDHSLRKL